MKKQLLAIAVTALAAGTVFAQANDTLAKIKSSGSVTLGVRESSGLGYTLGNGKYVGPALCAAIQRSRPCRSAVPFNCAIPMRP